MPVDGGGAEDGPLGGGVASRTLDGLAPHRCRRPVRVSISTGRMGENLSVGGPALCQKAQAKEEAEGGGGARAIPVVRYSEYIYRGVRDRPRRADRYGGGVLPQRAG